MTRFEQIKLEAMALPDAERELLAERLLRSLPASSVDNSADDEYDVRKASRSPENI